MVRPDARRLLRALLLGLAVFLVIGGGTGFALAASDGARGGPLQVPAPGPGDRASYEGHTVTLDPAARPLSVAVRMELEWLPAVHVSGPDFVVREAHPLRALLTWAVGLPQEDTYERLTYYDATTGEPVLRVGNGTSWVDDGWHYGVVLDDALGAPPARLDYFNEVYAGRMGLCGMRVPFQGRAYDGEPFTTMGVCAWEGPVTYEPQGWTGQGDERAFVFASVEDPRFQLAYDRTSPFPASLHSTLNVDFLPPDWAFGRHVAFTRTTAERSGLAYAAPGPSHELGAVRLAPTTPWTLDDAAVQHPFPLREAFAAAMAETDPVTDLPQASGDSGPTTAAEFYELHPDAYLAVAIFQFAADREGRLHPNWWLAFTDGHDVLARRVERAPPSVQSMVYAPAGPTQDTVSPWNADPDVVPDDATGVFPPPALVPASMPLVADVLARYEDLTGVPATAYGFDVRCADERCQAVHAHVAGGESRADLETIASSAGSPVVAARTVFDHIWVMADGRLAARVSFREHHEGRLHLVPSQVDDDGTRAAASAPLAAGVWQAPSAPAVASLSFLALVASALYYFWPALKGLPALAGFSRIEDGRILDHPTRRRVHDAVVAEPGIHFQALARKAGVGRGTLDHHLRKLVAAGLVTVRRSAGYTCYIAKGQVDRRLADAAPALRSEGSRAVLQAVATRPGASSRDLAAHLGLAPSTVSYHLKRLNEAGLVFGSGDGAGARLSPLGEQAAA